MGEQDNVNVTHRFKRAASHCGHIVSKTFAVPQQKARKRPKIPSSSEHEPNEYLLQYIYTTLSAFLEGPKLLKYGVFPTAAADSPCLKLPQAVLLPVPQMCPSPSLGTHVGWE